MERMLTDVLTVMWKERKGLFRVRGRRTQALLAILSPVLLAVYLPLQEGARWVDSPLSVLLAFVVPLILVGMSIPDSFAGERERHTLPTLLASRLPDRAILFGKISTSVALGWLTALAMLAGSLLVANGAHWDGRVSFYQPTILLADVGLSFLVAMLTATAGVLFSLRSATAQEAQQTLMAVLLIPPMLLQFALFAVMQSEPAQARLGALMRNVSFEDVVLTILAVLLVLVAGLSWTAVARFKRDRLVAA